MIEAEGTVKVTPRVWRICGIDPGGTTGIAIIEWDGKQIPPGPESLSMTLQVSYPEMPKTLVAIVRDVDLLAIERFVISPRTVAFSRQPEALYVIGGALFLADLAGVPTRMQAASDAKGAYDNQSLRGWAVRGPHARDALRHALLACHAGAPT